MFRRVKSLLTYVAINCIRIFDHSWRRLTGLPTLKRSEITPSLYLGGQYYKRGFKTIHKIGITGIVNMREHNIKKQKGMEHIHILHLPTKDQHAPTLKDLQKGIEFIQSHINTGGKVYVHCRWGEGRGPTMAIAYLMSTGMLLDEAFTFVKNVRPFIKPTKPQIEMLEKLEQELNND